MLATQAPSAPFRTRLARTALVGGALAWVGLVALGFASLFEHAATPGAAAAAPLDWPDTAPVPRDPNLPSLQMFVHAGCPCSLASLRELERVVAKCSGRVAVTVHVLDEPALGLDVKASPAWEIAARLPGAHARLDRHGAAARAFGVTTSGTVVMYAPGGHLTYHGGITGSRGHEGDNAGLAAVLARIENIDAPVAVAPVFGCDLIDPAGSPPR